MLPFLVISKGRLMADTAMSALLESHMLNDRLLHDTATSTQVMSYNG